MFAIRTLATMPYANAKVMYHDDGSLSLISYTTEVARISEGGWLSIYGLYSATTRRHIGAFVKEYANLTYQIAKRFYADGYRYNIYTGELAP